jgi:hypothetical protein
VGENVGKGGGELARVCGRVGLWPEVEGKVRMRLKLGPLA